MSEDNILFTRTSDSDSNNPWDDTDLVLAYDLAHNKVCEELGVKPKKTGNRKPWRKGDYCRCKYTADGLSYEAKIAKILDAENCIVKYLGYGNEEKVHLDSLQQSMGQKARKVQVKESQEPSAMDYDEASNADGAVSESPSSVKNLTHKHKPSTSHKLDIDNFSLPAPPPPLPDMFQREGNEAASTDEAVNAMLLSWYMSGYHTGYYEGLKKAGKLK